MTSQDVPLLDPDFTAQSLDAGMAIAVRTCVSDKPLVRQFCARGHSAESHKGFGNEDSVKELVWVEALAHANLAGDSFMSVGVLRTLSDSLVAYEYHEPGSEAA